VPVVRKIGTVLVLTLGVAIAGLPASSAVVGAGAGVGAVTAGNPAAGAVHTARGFSRPAAGRLAVSGGQLWASRYNGPGNSVDQAYSVTVNPDGATVYVTGESVGSATGFDYATIAYDTATGVQLWASRYNGPASGSDIAHSVAVSPDGATEYVTGQSLGSSSGFDYATVAYNAATGKRLWARRYNGPGNGTDIAYSVTVSPDGRAVYVTGQSVGSAGFDDYATVAYDGATGKRLWARRYNGPGSYNEAYSVAVSPTKGTVYVTGQSLGSAGFDYATVAYGAATGQRLWVKRYNGPGNGADYARSVAVSPTEATVYVTGQSYGGAATGYDYATVAYNAATGARRWVSRYNGPASSTDAAYRVAVSPNTATVYVTGYSAGGLSTLADYATVAYNPATGAQLWASRYNGPASRSDAAYSLAVSLDGTAVYVTGGSYGGSTLYDYATVAYDVATGAQLWASRYNGPSSSEDVASAVAVSPTNGTVFVSGESWTPPSDYATVAYHP
jgi:DNA-binding beta-propeller fold protein YncE